MRNIPSGVLFFVFSVSSVLPLWGSGKAQWEIIAESQIDDDIKFSAFEGPQMGMSGGDFGNIHRSVDLGTSWQKMDQAQGVGGRYVFELLGDSFCVSSGYNGMALTRNRGEHWEKCHDLYFSALGFMDERTGWVLGDEQWLRTRDAGGSWEISTLQRSSNGRAYISHDLNYITLTETGTPIPWIVVIRRL